ncbi:hypothetical protein EK904_006665, partial [Melospiza melodia maxima]
MTARSYKSAGMKAIHQK